MVEGSNPPVQTWAALHDRHTDKLAAIKTEKQKHRWKQQTDDKSNRQINVVYFLLGTAIEKHIFKEKHKHPLRKDNIWFLLTASISLKITYSRTSF